MLLAIDRLYRMVSLGVYEVEAFEHRRTRPVCCVVCFHRLQHCCTCDCGRKEAHLVRRCAWSTKADPGLWMDFPIVIICNNACKAFLGRTYQWTMEFESAPSTGFGGAECELIDAALLALGDR